MSMPLSYQSSHPGSQAQVALGGQRSFTVITSTQNSWVYQHSTPGSHDQPGLREDTLPQEASRLSMTSTSCEGSMPSSLYFQYPLPLGPVPPPRWAHTATAVGNSVVVFGGIGSSLLDDIQVLDCSTMSWRTITTSAPSSKDRPEKVMAHAAAAVGNRIWMFGGQQGRKYLAKLYTCDVGDSCLWQRHNNDTLPAPRAGHSMVAVGSYIYLFGGQGKKFYSDVHVLNTETGLFRALPEKGRLPSPRRGQSLVFDGQDNLILFGGTSAAGTDNTLSVFSISRGEWFTPAASGPAPSARSQHTAVMVSPWAMLVFGGCNSHGQFFNDAYILDTQTFTWCKPQLLNTPPAPRYHHSCCIVNGKCFIYGGINSKQTFEGVVVVETKFMNDISHIAEELSAMSAGFTDRTPRTPVTAPESSLAPRELSSTGPSFDLDVMKLQLTDLLLKRSMEERHVQATLKAEATELLLAKERASTEALNKELLQMRLLIAEAEEEKQQWEARARDAAYKLQKESAALFDMQQKVEQLQSRLAEKDVQLAEAKNIQQGLVKELGVLSSRYCKMQKFCESVGKKRSDALSGARQQAPRSEELSSSLMAGSDISEAQGQGDEESSSTALCGSSTPSFSTTDQLTQPSTRHLDSDGQPTASAYEQLLQMLTRVEMQRASLLEEVTVLQQQNQQLEAEKKELERAVDRLDAQPAALQCLTIDELQALERRLEVASRTVREGVLQRTIAEVQKKASSEQLQCSVCLEHPKSVVFNCGHQCCEGCSAKMAACPFCRVSITTKIKLFDV